MSLFAKFLLAITAFLPAPRIIYSLDGKSPYLSRWYLVGAPTMPDGSSPFTELGAVREGVVWPPGGGIYLHRFHASDQEPELHNHPFRDACALVLSGGYIEERRVGDTVIRREVLPGDVNPIDGDDFHRVELIGKESWSLFWTREKVHSWGFWDRVTKAFTPHREFFKTRAAAKRLEEDRVGEEVLEEKLETLFWRYASMRNGSEEDRILFKDLARETVRTAYATALRANEALVDQALAEVRELVRVSREPAPVALRTTAESRSRFVEWLHDGTSDRLSVRAWAVGEDMAHDVDALAAEVVRLRKLFDDAGKGEHDVLALVDHYQAEVIAARYPDAIPRDDWDHDIGPALWWKFPVNEPPYVGSPLDEDFPDYVTHWTRILVPDEPGAKS